MRFFLTNPPNSAKIALVGDEAPHSTKYQISHTNEHQQHPTVWDCLRGRRTQNNVYGHASPLRSRRLPPHPSKKSRLLLRQCQILRQDCRIRRENRQEGRQYHLLWCFLPRRVHRQARSKTYVPRRLREPVQNLPLQLLKGRTQPELRTLPQTGTPLRPATAGRARDEGHPLLSQHQAYTTLPTKRALTSISTPLFYPTNPQIFYISYSPAYT